MLSGMLAFSASPCQMGIKISSSKDGQRTGGSACEGLGIVPGTYSALT